MTGAQFADCMADKEIGTAEESTLFDAFEITEE